MYVWNVTEKCGRNKLPSILVSERNKSLSLRHGNHKIMFPNILGVDLISLDLLVAAPTPVMKEESVSVL